MPANEANEDWSGFGVDWEWGCRWVGKKCVEFVDKIGGKEGFPDPGMPVMAIKRWAMSGMLENSDELVNQWMWITSDKGDGGDGGNGGDRDNGDGDGIMVRQG